MPAVSVIIPTYNCGKYVKAAVDSVLGQSFRDFEVLVIDDGSTDETPDVMRQYGERVRYLRQINGGVARARNRGLDESRGRYVAFLDADDIWLPLKLTRQLSALAFSPEHRVSYTACTMTDPELNPLAVYHRPYTGRSLETLLIRNFVGTPSSVLGERALFMQTGGFDPVLSQCADWEMWLRVATRSEFLYVDEPLILYREHAGNMSRNVSVLERDTRRVLEKAFGMPEVAGPLRACYEKAVAHNFMVLAGSYFHARHHWDFIRCAAYALAVDFHQGVYLATTPLRWLVRRGLRRAENVQPLGILGRNEASRGDAAKSGVQLGAADARVETWDSRSGKPKDQEGNSP